MVNQPLNPTHMRKKIEGSQQKPCEFQNIIYNKRLTKVAKVLILMIGYVTLELMNGEGVINGWITDVPA